MCARPRRGHRQGAAWLGWVPVWLGWAFRHDNGQDNANAAMGGRGREVPPYDNKPKSDGIDHVGI